jgi:hypothetical protein
MALHVKMVSGELNTMMIYTSGIQPVVRVPPGVREDTLRFSILSFETYYLIHYFGCNLF